MTQLSEKQLRERMDPVCDAFEAAWLRSERPLLTDLVQSAAPEIRSPLFTELLAIELEFRNQDNEVPGQAEYESRYPDFTAEIQTLFRKELRARGEELLKTSNETSQSPETPAVATDSAITRTMLADASDTVDDAGDEDASGEVEFRKYLKPSIRNGWLGRLGHYEIEVILGRGAFGIVAKALDEKLHRVVAIKLMNPGLAATSPPRQRFLREARTAAAVSHENIVAIYAVEEEPIPYLVMEYVPGQTLQQRMNERGPFEAKNVLRIGQQVAAGLAAAHSAKLIHRDIKPSNILLTEGPAERAKISDFGMARAVDDASMTQSGMIAGTPLYMAPEQALGEVLDPRADLFSLGSVLYQMASGRPPFRAVNTIAVLKRVCHDAPRPLNDVVPGVPDWLETIIFKLLEKKRDDRYQTAQELADLLARCQQELELNGKVTCVEVRPRADDSQVLPPARETDGKAKRKPIGWLIGGVLAVAAVIGFALMNGGKRTPDLFTPIATTSLSPTEAPTGNVSTILKGFRVVAEISSPSFGQSPLVSADYEWSEPVNLGAALNTDQWNDHPTVTADGLTLVFVKHPDGKPSQLWQSTREDVAQPFGAVVKLFEDTTSYDDYCPFQSHDGLTLWFHSTRPIAPDRSDQNLWVTRRHSVSEPFEKPQPLGPEINTNDVEGNAFVSADGLSLFFTRGKPEQFFEATRRTESDNFGNAHRVNVGFAGAWNGFPRLSADGRVLVFAAKLDEQRLWLATRDSLDANFGTPTQLDETVNVGEVSGPFLSADEKTLYFSSTRPGGFGRRDLWLSTRVKKETRPTEPLMSNLTPPMNDLTPPESDASPPEDIELGVTALGPKIAVDGLSLWFHAPDDRDTGDGRLILWQSWRQATNEPFGALVRVEDSINNQPDHNLSDVTFSADGLVLSFCRTKIEAGSNSDLWMSTRPSGDAAWSEPISVGPGVNSDHGEWEPELSPNGLELFFHSNRPNGYGITDLWVSRRANHEAEFGSAENLGPEVNSNDIEGGAALSGDGLTLMFHRFTPNGVSLWRATRKSLDAAFEAPQHVTIPIPADEQFISVSLSASGDELYGMHRSRDRIAIAMSRLKPDAAVAAEKNFALRVSPGVHVEMPTLNLDPAAPQTLEAWVTPAIKVREDKHVFGWPGPNSLFVRNDDSSWTFGLAHTDKYQFVHDSQPITPGRRVHVATVRTGQEFRLFVDGQRVASEQEHESPLENQSSPFSLSLASAKAAFSGDYDEVRVSRVARYDENFTPATRFEPDADTLALYHCDENGGEQLRDASGNNHHGQIIGQATWIDAATSPQEVAP